MQSQMRNIAVIGAGQMGTGIAQTVAAHGMKVMLADVDLARAEAGKANVEAALVKLMGRGKIEATEAESLLARITPVADYDPFAEADLIIIKREGKFRWNYLNIEPIQRIYERWLSDFAQPAATLLTRLKDDLEL